MQTGCQNMFEELLPIQLTYSYCSIHIRALYILITFNLTCQLAVVLVLSLHGVSSLRLTVKRRPTNPTGYY